jgi:hypothetical protein
VTSWHREESAGQVTLTSKRRIFHSLEVPVPSSFSRRRGADAPGTICQQLMKPTAPGTVCQRHGDQPLMGSRAWWRHLPKCRALIAEHGHCAARFLLASRNGKVIFPSWLGLERSS